MRGSDARGSSFGKPISGSAPRRAIQHPSHHPTISSINSGNPRSNHQHNIVQIPFHHQSHHSSWKSDNDAEGEDQSDTGSATSGPLFTLPHHAHQSSLYGPVPEIDKLLAQQHHDRQLGLIPDDEDPNDYNAHSSVSKSKSQSKRIFHKGFAWLRRKWGKLSDMSEDDRVDALGEWDYWKGYYCSVNPMFKLFRSDYFAWALIFAVGQCSSMELLSFMEKYGGAFLISTFFTYFGIGFPLYLIETGMGQYSGRKPLQMLRYLSPIFSGLGPVLYFRTFFLAIRSLAIFLYSVAYALDLYFCNINKSELLSIFYVQEFQGDNNFQFGTFQLSQIENRAFLLLMTLFLVTIFVTGTLNLKSLGQLFYVGIRLLFVLHCIYFIVICQRVIDTTNVEYGNDTTGNMTDKTHSSVSMFVPFQNFFSFDVYKLFNGRAWIDSVLYVVSSLSLGTLVHPYLGSRSFFHYRTVRDGFFLIVITYLWNAMSVVAIVLWTNYIAANTTQIKAAISRLGGPYGLFITYVMTHNQAQQTEQIEADVLFFGGLYYTTIGFSALLTLNGYIHVLTHCAYPEKTSIAMKAFIYSLFCLIFSVGFPTLLLTKEGLQHLIFVDFYINNHSALVIFVIGCNFWCMAYGHNLTKFVYDFRNMMHFEIFGANRVSAKYSKFTRLMVTICILLILMHSATLNQYPMEGKTNYSKDSWIPIIVTSCLIASVVVVGVFVKYGCKGYTGRRSDKRPLRPHRDWFKNRFHYKVCFIQKKDDDDADETSGHNSGSISDYETQDPTTQ